MSLSRRRWGVIPVVMAGAALAITSCDGGEEATGPGEVTVRPERIDTVLTNPGMGFANFHFGWWCDLPPVVFTPEVCAERVRLHWPDNYPEAGTAYFRWHWRDLEPVRGSIDFAMIDAAIQSANALDETLSFRVMTIDEGTVGVPGWLLRPPYAVAGEWRAGDGGTTFWPDYRDPTFQQEHARFVRALGERYDDHPAIDHVDIGSVGCWGEWNTACLAGEEGLVEIYAPQSDAQRDQIVAAFEALIDDYIEAFSVTPVVMLGLEDGRELEVMLHAIDGGAGWRVDCWGDWGIWGSAWSHQENLYPDMIANATAIDPDFPDVWRHAPVQLEVCGTMPYWHDLGWTADPPGGNVYKTFQWALERHASVLNAKFTDIPTAYVPAIEDLLKRNGYRFVLDSFTHHGTVTAGSETTFTSSWSNLGVAPIYLRRGLTYRLRGESQTAVFTSQQDVRDWLPGSWEASDTFTAPADLSPGTYDLELALLDREGSAPTTAPLPPLRLGIEGRREDGWYAVSRVEVE